MKFDIYATAEGKTPDMEGDCQEYVDRYTTREGAVAEVRRLLWQGRAVGVVPVPDDAPLPGGRATRSTSRRS